MCQISNATLIIIDLQEIKQIQSLHLCVLYERTYANLSSS